MIKDILILLKKDILIEFNGAYNIFNTVIFSFLFLILIYFLSGNEINNITIKAFLFWIIIFMTNIFSSGHLFFREYDHKTHGLLRINFSANSIFLSKWILNFIIIFLNIIFITPLFIIFFNCSISNYIHLLIILFCGAVTLTSSNNFLSFITARSRSKNLIFAIISIPILLPPLISLVFSMENLLNNNYNFNLIIFLISFSISLSLTSLLLFEKIWIED